jgi:diadenosine tetraphosphate (Ap4A) HIT family hydrolase
MTSPFLAAPPERWIASNDLAFALYDGFPVSPGHALIIPRRLVATWFEATREEQLAILELVDVVKAKVHAVFQRDGINGCFNSGGTAVRLAGAAASVAQACHCGIGGGNAA